MIATSTISHNVKKQPCTYYVGRVGRKKGDGQGHEGTKRVCAPKGDGGWRGSVGELRVTEAVIAALVFDRFSF
jgi:hypothetical protein